MSTRRVDGDSLASMLLEPGHPEGFDEFLRFGPTASVVTEADPLWLKLGPAAAGHRAMNGRIHIANTSSGVLSVGASESLTYVLEAACLDPSAAEGAPPDRLDPAELLRRLALAERSRPAASQFAAVGHHRAEVALATAEKGIFVNTGAILDAPLQVWRELLSSDSWYVDLPDRSELDRGADFVSRVADVRIGRFELASPHVRALAPGDVLLCDLEEFARTGACVARIGGLERDATLRRTDRPGRLELMFESCSRRVDGSAVETTADGVFIDVVAGRARIDPTEWFAPKSTPGSINVCDAFPEVLLLVAGRKLGRAELVNSTFGLALRVQSVSGRR